MTRCAVFLALLALLSCSKKFEEVVPPLVGRWTLVAQQDAAGAWTNFVPLVPVQFEFRADGSFDYVDAAGKPNRKCCEPTQYSFTAGTLTPSASSGPLLSKITFSNHVPCPNAFCFLPRTWVVLQISGQFLDLDQGEGQSRNQRFRYQRTR